MTQKAIVCFSGGMDSTTLLYEALAQGYTVWAVSFDYNQRHRIELESAANIAKNLGLPHKILKIDLGQIGGSVLTDMTQEVPDQAEQRQFSTVVPLRNALFCTLAASYGETIGVDEIFYGPVKEDFLAYRDCRRPFFDSLAQSLSLGSSNEGRNVQIHTPFVDLYKREVLERGFALGVPYELTHTCYRGQRPPCGECDACRERLEAFAQVGRTDPLMG
ncbi:MAG: 7-cyano-7-deazaguanine synthase QueC [Chloroflexi bacterium]|nr:7-cyano-7-deazaguanine synthase QueC [Chloroflexota bacterium]OJW04393.1 MAG: 7-cyano-7-deazaguanine synthase QueC [Chloroflexi bacterium 54-19]